MAKNKTTSSPANVHDFIHSFANSEQRKKDSFELIALLQEITGEEPKIWGPSIIGFGNYHYQYASGHKGEAPVLGFSPRKAAISLYVYSDTGKSQSLLPGLGKFKMGKSCIYVNKLADISRPVLKALCAESVRYIDEHHGCSCRKK